MANSWVIKHELARGQRPGYSDEKPRKVLKAEVDQWITSAKKLGVKSIICLLAEDQLSLYSDLPEDLVSYYKAAGFEVAHIPAHDHQNPPLTSDYLEQITSAYASLSKPVLIHCSAGIDRTGAAVGHLKKTRNQKH